MKNTTKNSMDIILQTTNARVTFCYGKKSYKSYMKEHFNEDFNEDEEEDFGGITSTRSDGNLCLIIGIKKTENINFLKECVVHEISHAVTTYMRYYGFECDEVRSYTLGFLYNEIMPSLDSRIEKDRIAKSKKKKRKTQ